MANAELEITGAIVRVFDGSHSNGAPHRLAVSIVGDDDTAIVKALNTNSLSAEHAAAIARALLECGFTYAKWYRHRDGGVRAVKVRLDRTAASAEAAAQA